MADAHTGDWPMTRVTWENSQCGPLEAWDCRPGGWRWNNSNGEHGSGGGVVLSDVVRLVSADVVLHRAIDRHGRPRDLDPLALYVFGVFCDATRTECGPVLTFGVLADLDEVAVCHIDFVLPFVRLEAEQRLHLDLVEQWGGESSLHLQPRRAGEGAMGTVDLNLAHLAHV